MLTSRITPRLGALIATAALALSVSSCGGDSDEATTPAAATSAAATPSTSPTPTPSADPSIDPADLPSVNPDTGEIDFCTANTKPFTGKAADFFGADEVRSAYCSMVTFSLTRGMSSPMIVQDTFPDDYPPQMFASVERFMTARQAEQWRADVRNIEEDPVSVYGLVMFAVSVGGEGDMVFNVVDDGQPFTTGGSASEARTSVEYNDENEARLNLRFSVETNIITTGSDDKNYHLPVKRDLEYTLAPTGNPEMPWLIDGYKSATSFPEIPTEPSPRIDPPSN